MVRQLEPAWGQKPVCVARADSEPELPVRRAPAWRGDRAHVRAVAVQEFGWPGMERRIWEVGTTVIRIGQCPMRWQRNKNN